MAKYEKGFRLPRFSRRHFCREAKETPLGKRNSAPGSGAPPPSDTPGDVFVVEAPFARRVDIRRVKAKAYMFVSTLVFVPATAVWGRGMGIGVGGGNWQRRDDSLQLISF